MLPGYRLPVAELFGWLKQPKRNPKPSPPHDPRPPLAGRADLMKTGRRVAQRPRHRPLRLAFDAGTLVVEGLPERRPGLPGVKFDFRTKQFRAEAIWYRTIVEHLRKHKETTPTPMPRGYEPTALAAPGRQGGVSRTRSRG